VAKTTALTMQVTLCIQHSQSTVSPALPSARSFGRCGSRLEFKNGRMAELCGVGSVDYRFGYDECRARSDRGYSAGIAKD